MNSSSDVSRLYTIGNAVSELRRSFPDVTHSSLRFLEREGLIEPVRTEGGHRKFRASDLERVRRIKEWQAQHLSLDEIRRRLAIMEQMAPPQKLWPVFLEHALEGRIHEATAVVVQADEAGFPLSTIFQDLLTPALLELGRRWAEGTITVGQEHEVSELVRDMIADLTSRHVGRLPEDFSVLAACVEGELHELGLRMLFGLLRQRGVLVHFLGANVPTSFLVESTLMRQPDVVVLSVTINDNLPALREAIGAIRGSIPDELAPHIVVGGADGLRLPEADGDHRLHVIGAAPLADAIESIMALRPVLV